VPKRARGAYALGSPSSGTLTAARLKVTTRLNARDQALTAPEGKPRVTLRIRLPDRIVTSEIAAKSLGKAQTAKPTPAASSPALCSRGRRGPRRQSRRRDDPLRNHA
jgi:hypothetical protein